LHVVLGGSGVFDTVEKKDVLLGRLPLTAKLLAVVELEMPVPPVFWEVKLTTPGLSVSRRSKLRPLSGRSLICRSPTSPEMSLVVATQAGRQR